MTRSLRLIVPIFLLAWGCGQTNGPVEIPASDLPFSVTRSDSPAETPSSARTYAVYYVREGRLHEVRRKLETEADPPAAVVRALIEGPDRDEKELGITTELPAEVRLLGVRITAGTAGVDLSGEFQQPAPPEVIALRVAQVVWTLTAIPEIRSVSFSIDGDPVAVTTDEGDAVERRVSRNDYERVSPS